MHWDDMRIRLAPLVVGLAALPAAPGVVMGQDLPPAIHVARHLAAADAHMEDGDARAALAALDRILELQAEHDIEIPDDFWFKHAQAAWAVGDAERAETSVTRYLELTLEAGEHYQAALELYNEAEEARQAEEPRLEEELRLAEEARLAEERRQWAATPPAERARLEELRRPGRVFTDCERDCPEMVVVPAGTFVMGSPPTEEGRSDREGPRHVVTIPAAFAVGVYEVTSVDWYRCKEAGGCPDVGMVMPGLEFSYASKPYPWTGISWEDAQAYVRWLSRHTGEQYRLLSEAEWEYAARAGSRTARYWGESASYQCTYANGDGDRAPCRGDGYRYSAPVGSYMPNAFGLHDMLGNSLEWTQDCWHDGYAGAPVDGTARESGNCSIRVIRGGSWMDGPAALRAAAGAGRSSDRRQDLGIFGFRVARTLN